MRHWRHKYHVKVDGTERVRWCRQNLGERGDRWDFVGGFKTSIYIQSDEDAALYDKYWRFWNVLRGDKDVDTYYNS
jgi:hypothetical protein